MPELKISFAEFDTVCYSTQYNIIQLIKHCVGIALQVNINIGNITNLDSQVGNINSELGDLSQLIDQLKEQLEGVKNEGDDTAGDVNSLVLRVNALEKDVSKLKTDFNVFSYAVTQDLNALGQRVTTLESKVG